MERKEKLIEDYDVTVNLWIRIGLPKGLEYEEWEDYARDKVYGLILRELNRGYIIDYKILNSEINK